MTVLVLNTDCILYANFGPMGTPWSVLWEPLGLQKSNELYNTIYTEKILKKLFENFEIIKYENIRFLMKVYIRAYEAAPRNPLKNPNPIKIPPQINKVGLFNIITE